MVVVLDEFADLGFQVAGQIIVLQQNAVLQRLMPAFDLALRLGMAGSAAPTPSDPIAAGRGDDECNNRSPSTPRL
jgi:hypothetical protein